jgi:RNA polymerase sigma factor (sigma-70 family)
MNLLRSPEDARDVYQEAFLRVYRNLHSFRFDCSFHTWLYRIVTNICLDQLRKRKVRKEESATVETSEGPVDRMDAFHEEAAHADPERSLWNRQLRARIENALKDLTPRERMVFELRHYQVFAAAQHRRDPGHHRRGRQKLPLPRNSKDAHCVGRFHMNCDSISTLIPLYYYGELTPEQEDSVEEHTHECRDCAQAVEQQRQLAAALDRREMQAPPLLIEDCRADLLATLHGGVARMPVAAAPSKSKGPWGLFLDAVAHSLSQAPDA